MTGHESDQDASSTPPQESALEFDQFFRGEYRPVLGLAYVLCGNWSTAEELTMDAFEAALRRWRRVSALDMPGAWVRKVVANSVISRARKAQAERRATERLRSEQLSGALTASAEVWDSLRRLPRRQAQAAALFYVAGYGRAEVATTLGISEESVKTHLDRARQQLRKELAD